ncbi:MAG: hypothetical protein ACJA0P_003121 [Planctomycetota bacterium]|jgi:hypothetical protein
MNDEELTAKRAAYPNDGRHEEIKAWGPPEGLYAPAHPSYQKPQEAR